MQRHEARAAGGLRPQLWRCLRTDAVRRPVEGPVQLQHCVVVVPADDPIRQPLGPAAGPVDGEEPQRLGGLTVVTLNGGGLAVLQGQQQGLS